ncbi:hypothetical protein [Vandammella animalimorsus]|nr:hypothetical protein [Vandammella animalimorsus]
MNVQVEGGPFFHGTYDYSYDVPASLSKVAGDFLGPAVTGASNHHDVAITIGSDGQVTAHENYGCRGSGRVTPRASGKNVFDLYIRFYGATCALGDRTSVNGIAVYDEHRRSVWAMGTDDSASDGFIYQGYKR